MLVALLLTAPAWALDIPHERYTLPNGLTVMLLEDHRLPQVVVDVWFGVGSFDDPPGASGFAHLFEHLMFKGTPAVPEGQFDARMEAAGARNNASTGDDRTNYYAWGTSNTLDLLLYLEADRMTGLEITQAKLDTEREVVRNERRQNYEDAPYGRIWLDLPEMMFPVEHPYHLSGIGTHEDLMAATLDTVTGFYRGWYQPGNATLVVAGDFDTAWVKGRIAHWFGGIPAGAVQEHLTPPVVSTPVERERTVTDAVQLPATIHAWHSPSLFAPGDAEMDVLADLLAGGADARLTRRLVHEEQVATEVFAFQSSAQRGSMFVVGVIGMPGASLDVIDAAVAEELAAVAEARPVTAEELARAVNGREMSFLVGLESLMGRAEALQGYWYHLGRSDYLAEDLERYRAVTAEGLSEAARRLTPENGANLKVLPEEGR